MAFVSASLFKHLLSSILSCFDPLFVGQECRGGGVLKARCVFHSIRVDHFLQPGRGSPGHGAICQCLSLFQHGDQLAAHLRPSLHVSGVSPGQVSAVVLLSMQNALCWSIVSEVYFVFTVLLIRHTFTF